MREPCRRHLVRRAALRAAALPNGDGGEILSRRFRPGEAPRPGVPRAHDWSATNHCLCPGAGYRNTQHRLTTIEIPCMNVTAKIKSWLAREVKPEHLRRGELGERAAKKHLRKLGLKFL